MPNLQSIYCILATVLCLLLVLWFSFIFSLFSFVCATFTLQMYRAKQFQCARCSFFLNCKLCKTAHAHKCNKCESSARKSFGAKNERTNDRKKEEEEEREKSKTETESCASKRNAKVCLLNGARQII